MWSQNLSVNDLKWFTDFFVFDEDWLKRYSDESNKAYFLKVDVQDPENLHNLHKELSSFP